MDQTVRKILSLFLLLQFGLNVTNVHSLFIPHEKNFDEKNLEVLLKSMSPNSLFKNLQNTVIIYNNNETIDTNICRRDIDLMQQALVERELWAMKMLDASSKLPAGILQGNIVDLGMFDECVASVGQIEDVEIRGRHCMYTTNIIYNKNLLFSPKLSICIPASCTADDTANFINNTINNITQLESIRISLKSVTCVPILKNSWDTEYIAWFVVLTVFLSFLIVSTIFDVFFTTNDDKQRTDSPLLLVASFSLRRSISAIFNTEVKQGNLPVIHGIRFLSTAWVILGHRFAFNSGSVNVNPAYILEWMASWKSLYIFTAPFAVDTFFAISGLLLAYMFFNSIPKQKYFNVPKYYLHRFLRLTPSVVCVLIFTIVFMPYVGSGPQWETTKSDECRKNWWILLLYIQNFKNYSLCLGHLWYLAVDMQLFWFSPFILYPLYKKPKIGLIFLGFVTLVTAVVNVSLITINKYKVSSMIAKDNQTTVMEAFHNIYTRPYTRGTPWFIGIFFGYSIVNNNRKLNKTIIYLGWFFAIGAFVFCCLGTRYFMNDDYVYDAALEAAFSTISRSLWGFAICWIIYASYYNYGGPISKILSWKVFFPLSRISYCTYLVHFVIQEMDLYRTRTSHFFSNYEIWQTFLSDLLVSLTVGFFFSLLFESPIITLERLLFRNKQRKKEESHNEFRIKDEEHIKNKKF